jgi:hypothetical protein
MNTTINEQHLSKTAYVYVRFLLFKLRGLGLLPRWDSHPLVDASLHWTHTFRDRSVPR